jgi:LacI family transcriptional regulator
MASTIKDIANQTGLGLATISKYLNGGNVLPKNRDAIEAAISKLNYSPNTFARGLKTKRSKAVGVVLPEINNTFLMGIVMEMEYTLKREDYAIVVSDCHNDKNKEIEAVHFLLSKSVDAIISAPLSRSGRHLQSAIAQNVPVLLIDRAIPELADKVDSITIDNSAISYKAVSEQIIGKGHKRIGIITGAKGVYTADARWHGYNRALEENGIEADPALVWHGDFTVESGLKGYKELLAKNPDITAIFATNHYITMGVLMAVNEEKKQIPGDISVLGFDLMDWLQVINPPLTIIEQPVREIGRLAAEILIKRLLKEEYLPKQAITLSARLNIGESICHVVV